MGHTFAGSAYHARRLGAATLHGFLHQPPASGDSVAYFGGGLLRLGLVSQSRQSFIMDRLFRGYDRSFGGGYASRDACGLFTIAQGVESSGEQVTVYAA